MIWYPRRQIWFPPRVEVMKAMPIGTMSSRRSMPAGGQSGPVAGYSAWYRSDLSIYTDTGFTTPATTTGDLIAGWKDQSGTSNNNLTQATSGKRPSYKTNAINGHPSLVFNPAHPDVLFQTAHTIDPWSIYGVVKFTNVSPTSIATIITSDDSGHHRQVHRTSGGLLAMYSGTNLNGTASGTSWLYFSAEWGGGGGISDLLRKNAVTIAGPGNANNFATTTTWGIGSGTQFIEGMEGEIAEIVLYTTVLSVANRTLNEQYFSARYGI